MLAARRRLRESASSGNEVEHRKQHDGADEGREDDAGKSGKRCADTELAEYPSADECADNAHDDVADESDAADHE